MSKLWLLLLAFLQLGAGPGEQVDLEADPDETLDELIDGDDDATTDDLEAAADEDAAPEKPPRVSKREQELQNQLEQERATRRQLEARATPPAQPAVDPEYEREEREIAAARQAGATEDQLKWQKWAIDQARTVRSTQRTSNEALSQARDLADKAAFDRLEFKNPGLYKRYADKVEQGMAELRAKGIYPQRQLLLNQLVGDDIVKGKVIPKAKSKAAPSVERGRSPTTRSDVRARSGTSEREKRRARLENQRI